MASIPKKVSERFIKSTSKFQKVLQIAKDRDVNESDTVSILTDILSEVLGYDKYIEITSELAIRGTYCDLAIVIDDKTHFLIEAKAIGITLKDAHMKQACDYGANHGVQWIVLTNGLEWKVYRIRFEQPINFDLVFTFDFTELNARDEKCQELLFLLSREGLAKNAREEYFDRVQSVNKYMVGNLLTSDQVLAIVRRELRKISDGIKIEQSEIEEIIRTEVLKRDIVVGDDAEHAQARIRKFYRKAAAPKRQKPSQENQKDLDPNESLSDRILRESQESQD